MERLKVRSINKIVPDWRKRDLKIKQARFIAAYLSNGQNGTQAYKEAGYKAENDPVAASCASTLLRNPKVEKAINEYMDKFVTNKAILRRKVLQIYADMASFDPKDILSPDGELKCDSLADIPLNLRRCIAGIETRYYGKDAERKKTIVKLVDRKAALDKLAQHTGLIKDQAIHKHQHFEGDIKIGDKKYSSIDDIDEELERIEGKIEEGE
jgi:hypothetical protein